MSIARGTVRVAIKREPRKTTGQYRANRTSRTDAIVQGTDAALSRDPGTSSAPRGPGCEIGRRDRLIGRPKYGRGGFACRTADADAAPSHATENARGPCPGRPNRFRGFVGRPIRWRSFCFGPNDISLVQPLSVPATILFASLFER